jgi:hypothetical protein
MRNTFAYDGQLSYDLEDFCETYGHPAERRFTIEITHNAVTYVYAEVVGTVRAGQVIFDLNADDLVDTRKSH